MIKYAMYNATRTTASFFLSFPSLNIQNIKKAVTILKGKSYTIETLGSVYVEINAPRPAANIGFVILLPIRTPAEILDFFLKTAIKDVVISGKAEATPRMITPKNEALKGVA